MATRPGVTDPKIVLVVDDHVEMRELMTDFLRRLGFIAIPVPDGESARIVAEKLRVDLILLDLVLPDIKGTALLPQLKNRRPEMPIVIISGHLSSDAENECRSLGADEVFHKPLDLKELKVVIFRLLGLPDPQMRRYSPKPSGKPLISDAASDD